MILALADRNYGLLTVAAKRSLRGEDSERGGGTGYCMEWPCDTKSDVLPTTTMKQQLTLGSGQYRVHMLQWEDMYPPKDAYARLIEYGRNKG